MIRELTAREKADSERIASDPVHSVGLSQQALHLAHAACDALGLDFEDTSPNDIHNSIHALNVLLDFVQASPIPHTKGRET